jgi:hypothetical protein
MLAYLGKWPQGGVLSRPDDLIPYSRAELGRRSSEYQNSGQNDGLAGVRKETYGGRYMPPVWAARPASTAVRLPRLPVCSMPTRRLRPAVIPRPAWCETGLTRPIAPPRTARYYTPRGVRRLSKARLIAWARAHLSVADASSLFTRAVRGARTVAPA